MGRRYTVELTEDAHGLWSAEALDRYGESMGGVSECDAPGLALRELADEVDDMVEDEGACDVG